MKLSFSQWETWQQCPRKWEYKYHPTARVEVTWAVPRSPAADRGTDIHKQIEEYILGEVPVGQYPVKHYTEVLDVYREYDGGRRYNEEKLYFDAEWYVCSKNSTERRWTLILDALREEKGRIIHIGEWKTGKPKDTHADQRLLYTLGAFRAFGPKEVITTTYYFDGTAEPARIKVKETYVPKLIKLWDERHDRMQDSADGKFRPPRPGFYCRWCDYSKDKGGPCPFSG